MPTTSSTITTQEDDFGFFVGSVLFAYQEFCLNRTLHKVLTDQYRIHKEVWNHLLLSGEECYLLGLAKCFDRHRDKPLSLYHFDKTLTFPSHKSTIEKILDWRDKWIAHYDRSATRQFDTFLQERGLSVQELEALFITVISTCEERRKHFGLPGDLISEFAQRKQAIEDEAIKWAALFQGPKV